MKASKKIEPTVKKPTEQLTIKDLEAKLKKLGLDTDLFVRKVIRDPDKG